MRFFSYLAVLLFAVLLAACGGGGGSPGTTSGAQAFFTTAPASLSLPVGSAQEFVVAGGQGPYIAVSNNAAIAVAGISENRLTVGAVGPGTAQITLRDSAGATTNVAVISTTQDLFTTAPSGGITLVPGTSAAQTYRIGGGLGPYTATSNNVNVASVALNGSNLTVTGVTAGTAVVQVRDNFGTTQSITVTVTPVSNLALFTTAPPSITVAVGGVPTYTIGGGTGPYTATSSNTNVASVSVNGGVLTVNGVAAGSATVVIRDAAGALVTLAVTVGGGSLTVNPSSATALIGDVLFAKVTGGRGPYTAVVTNAAVADATITSDGLLRVSVKQQAASVPILITDADGLSTSFTITSSQGQATIQMSPTSLTISELSGETITLQVYGASGGIQAFSSDTSLLQATASGNTVIVSTGSKGNRCVVGDKSVTISVVDATSAMATSTILIKDSVSATCP